jgi:hypothetical protein
MIDRSKPMYLNCPRCGLSIRRRAEWLTVEHCPRCLGRSRIAVELFVSSRPSSEWRATSEASLRAKTVDPGGT